MSREGMLKRSSTFESKGLFPNRQGTRMAGYGLDAAIASKVVITNYLHCDQ